MTNIYDAVKGIFSTYDDEPLSPLHVGEVMNLWTYLTTLDEANRYVEIGLNTTTDEELRKALRKSFEDCNEQIKEIETFLKKEGVSLPPTSKSKPDSDLKDVPLGVKLTDDEIANGLSIKLVSALLFCATGSSQAIRTDIGNMWLRFFLKRAEYGAYLKALMRKRGWIKVPPYYYPPGMPQNR